MDIDYIERSQSYTLKDIAKCSTKYPPSLLLGNENLNITSVSRDAQASCRLVPPFSLNKHIHPFGMSNPKYHCYMVSVIQLLFSILWVITSTLIPVQNVPYQTVYLKQHIVHPVLQLCMPSNFDWYNMIYFTVAKFSRIVLSASWC